MNSIDEALKDIGAMTNINNHSTARTLGAILLGDKDLINEATNLEIAHNKLGRMSPELMERSNDLDFKLAAKAGEIFSAEYYHKFRSAY